MFNGASINVNIFTDIKNNTLFSQSFQTSFPRGETYIARQMYFFPKNMFDWDTLLQIR